MLDDLNNWTTLYVAGRLHKPVEVLKSNSVINQAIKRNLEHAVNVALSFLPEKITEEELYGTIAGLSYLGDSRMGIAENPDKVRNIVSKNLDRLRELYKYILEDENVLFRDGSFFQDVSEENFLLRRAKFPENLKKKISEGMCLREAIVSIVKSSSTSQTIKGVVSAGLINSVKYVIEKRRKVRRK